MARKRQDARLGTRSARIGLKQRSEPYWRNVSKGLAVGYFKGAKGGTWIGRHFSVETGRRKASLGIADDFMDADGICVLSFDHAQAAAQDWHRRLVQEDSGEVIAGAYTVAQAMADYLKDRERVRRKELSRTRSVIDAHIVPLLGPVELAKLTHGKVKAWRNSLAEAMPRVRNKPDATEQAYRQIDATDADALRKRQATANRILTVLKAALNHAYKENRVATKAAWEKISPFREVDVPKVRYLTVNECKALIDACPSEFRAMVRGALYTGCRYGELTAMRVDAFNPDANTIHVERSKSGKGRYIPLTEEGAAFFASIASERKADAPMFTHAPQSHRKAEPSTDGKPELEPWEHSQQRYWMLQACETATIEPAIGFHILRHTYASQLAMNGTPMPVIAALLGHADTRMTEKHYGHLSPSYVADTLRANLPSFGFKPQTGPQLVAAAS
ncbi:MAG: tyrosine-type recombinase/integrase [Acidobacteriaceae bacterium]